MLFHFAVFRSQKRSLEGSSGIDLFGIATTFQLTNFPHSESAMVESGECHPNNLDLARSHARQSVEFLSVDGTFYRLTTVATWKSGSATFQQHLLPERGKLVSWNVVCAFCWQIFFLFSCGNCARGSGITKGVSTTRGY